jgi:predicted dehydrogenase
MEPPARVKIGFVGAGAITEHHLGNLGEQPDVEVAAVCDIDGERAQAVAERAGASAFTRWEEMLAAGGLDALFVCTPPMHHAAPAVSPSTP